MIFDFEDFFMIAILTLNLFETTYFFNVISNIGFIFKKITHNHKKRNFKKTQTIKLIIYLNLLAIFRSYSFRSFSCFQIPVNLDLCGLLIE
ncbi:hypothetical protein BpHYR1_006438 [Brachionus plicatilis]|uniref:Uncharacterized protein n=1 Tax=Brachionus plicatilis TaxID=10195 RepID=A0A3M7SYA3_BRAPC|nr:hypothetical protein BpHYR1_006438 [Brachionus plicatilis]